MSIAVEIRVAEIQMTFFNFPVALIGFYILIAISFVNLQEISYHMTEENRKDSVLGNLNFFITNILKTDPNLIDFHVSSKFFDIDNKLKNVLVNQKIDLDTLCNLESECCNEEICILKTKIVIQKNGNYWNTILMKVEIKDLDDNNPIFLEPLQVVRLSENIPINTNVTIDAAIDRDFSKLYQRKVYNFTDKTATFKLVISHTLPDSLAITVLKRLDYEVTKEYQCVLKVCDRKYQNCLEKSIVIQVIDENDNDPVFFQKKYKIKISEDYATGKEIIRVVAKDADGERYSITNYGLQGDYELKRIFNIGEKTGIISLKQKLSINKKSRYVLTVYAMDSLSLTFKKDFTTVEIDVEDVNDNSPTVSLLQGAMPDQYVVEIKENVPPKDLFSIRVVDIDKDENAKVNCSLRDDNYLELKNIDMEIYQIRTKLSFDYEQTQYVKGEIICSDSGVPRLTTHKYFTLNIIDVNEFEPVFKESNIELHFKENAQAGVYVYAVTATDKDKSAVITYQIDDIGSLYFSVDSRNGEIRTTNQAIDRETRESIQFQIIATDSVVEPKSVTALVTIKIIDQNDNAPQFIQYLPFVISENQFIYTKLSTKIEAIDADKDENNRLVTFRLLNTYNSKLESLHEQVFDINSKGEIETVAIIDREKDCNFTLTILAEDHGVPPLSTTTNITISILDINDNAPTWIYPDPNISSEPTASINISKNADVGLVIAKLRASDPDLNDGGRVTYSLFSLDSYGNSNMDFFSLNETTGYITIIKSPLLFSSKRIRVRAYDHGQPQMHQDANLVINVILSSDTLFGGFNMIIIIGMLSVTALVSLFLIIAIIFIRRTPKVPKTLRPRIITTNKNGNKDYCSSFNDLTNNLTLEKEQIFNDQLYQKVCYQSPEGTPVYSQFPQNTLEGGYPTYVRFSTANTCRYELDGESADSGKGTSDLDMTLQSPFNVSTANLYGNIQIIPTSKLNYFSLNPTLRRSCQVINEAEQLCIQDVPHQTNTSMGSFSQNMNSMFCSYQTLPFNSLPPYEA